jgi:hypothetical protein
VLAMICNGLSNANKTRQQRLRARKRFLKKIQPKPVRDFHLLTYKEQELFLFLCFVEPKGEFAKIIRRAIDDGTADKFREMVSMLKDQAIGAPGPTKEIIGTCAFNTLMELQTS